MNYRKTNEVSDWCDKNAMILHPAKTKSMLLASRQKRQLRPFVLNPNLKDNHVEQVHGPGTLALSSTMNLVGDPTLLAHAKQ